MADIPGLIEGAADGAGIGDRFLGHVERTKVLLHLVDANNEDVAEAYRIVRDELDAYGAGLENKPEVVALNKADTLDDELLDALADELEAECGMRPLRVSGATGAGTEAVLDTILRHLDAGAPEEAPEGDWSPV
jgi:GTP-binding protein